MWTLYQDIYINFIRVQCVRVELWNSVLVMITKLNTPKEQWLGSPPNIQ